MGKWMLRHSYYEVVGMTFRWYGHFELKRKESRKIYCTSHDWEWLYTCASLAASLYTKDEIPTGSSEWENRIPFLDSFKDLKDYTYFTTHFLSLHYVTKQCPISCLRIQARFKIKCCLALSMLKNKYLKTQIVSEKGCFKCNIPAHAYLYFYFRQFKRN
jgi:hypothetical protein